MIFNIENFISDMNFTSMIWQICGTLAFILADIISGFISALINHNVDSQKMREGLLRKMLLIIIIALSFIVQYAFFNMTIISKTVCVYIIFMEIVSILENLMKAGIDLKKLGELLNIKKDN